jgi:amidase
MRTALDRLSQRLVKVGVKVGRDSPLVPSLAESARLYMRSTSRGRSTQPGRQEPCGRAEPRHGIESSRLDRSRQSTGRPPAAMERAFSGVGCRALSTDVDTSISPRPQNALFGATYRDRGEGVSIFRSIGLAGNCYDAGPSRHSDIDRSFRDWTADVQIVGPYLEDRTTIAFAELMEREFGGLVPPPGYAG